MGLVVVTVLKLGFHCKRFPMWQKRFTEYEPVIRISLAFKSKLEQSRGGKMEDPIISKDSYHLGQNNLLAISWVQNDLTVWAQNALTGYYNTSLKTYTA